MCPEKASHCVNAFALRSPGLVCSQFPSRISSFISPPSFSTAAISLCLVISRCRCPLMYDTLPVMGSLRGPSSEHSVTSAIISAQVSASALAAGSPEAR